MVIIILIFLSLTGTFFMLQVLVLKELALNAPTFFFQQVQPFFENISNAVRDPKVNSNNYLYVVSDTQYQYNLYLHLRYLCSLTLEGVQWKRT